METFLEFLVSNFWLWGIIGTAFVVAAFVLKSLDARRQMSRVINAEEGELEGDDCEYRESRLVTAAYCVGAVFLGMFTVFGILILAGYLLGAASTAIHSFFSGFRV